MYSQELNAEFLKYLSTETTDKDAYNFVRANNDGSNLDQAKPYDIDFEVATSHDWLVTAIIAYEKYAKFIAGKLSGLEMDSN